MLSVDDAMLGVDLRSDLHTTNGGAGEHGKRNSHVSHVSLVSNMKEEEAMMGNNTVMVNNMVIMMVMQVRTVTMVWDCVEVCSWLCPGLYSWQPCPYHCASALRLE